MNKFTKGPWEVFDIHPSCACLYIAPQQDMSTEWGCKTIDDEICTAYASSEDYEANANLIAAAPEMYDFLDSLQLSVADSIKRDFILSKARGEQ